MEAATPYAKPVTENNPRTGLIRLARHGVARAWSDYKFWMMQGLSLSLALAILLAPGCQHASRPVSTAMTAQIPGSVPGAMSVYGR